MRIYVMTGFMLIQLLGAFAPVAAAAHAAAGDAGVPHCAAMLDSGSAANVAVVDASANDLTGDAQGPHAGHSGDQPTHTCGQDCPMCAVCGLAVTRINATTVHVIPLFAPRARPVVLPPGSARTVYRPPINA